MRITTKLSSTLLRLFPRIIIFYLSRISCASIATHHLNPNIDSFRSILQRTATSAPASGSVVARRTRRPFACRQNRTTVPTSRCPGCPGCPGGSRARRVKAAPKPGRVGSRCNIARGGGFHFHVYDRSLTSTSQGIRHGSGTYQPRTCRRLGLGCHQ